jgi:hypothetical protein
MGQRYFFLPLSMIAVLAVASTAGAGIIPGSQYTVASLGGFPGALAGTQTVTFDGKAETINSGKLTINEKQFADPISSQKQWLEFTIQSTNGAAIATPDVWNIRLNDLKFANGASYDAVPGQSLYMYFTINGTPVNISNPHFTTPTATIAAHPTDAAINVNYFMNTAGNADSGETTTQFFARVMQPMIFNGVDFTKVNGVVFGVAYTSSLLVPEPSTSLMMTFGAAGLGAFWIRRGRKPGSRRRSK